MFMASGEFYCLLALSFANVWAQFGAVRTSLLFWILTVWHADGIFLEKNFLKKTNPTIGGISSVQWRKVGRS